jgi:hypothetical protein
MPLAAVAEALGLPADTDETAILAEIMDLKAEDPLLARLQTALGMPDATAADLVIAVQNMMARLYPTADPVAEAKAPAIADPDGDEMITGAEAALLKVSRPGGADTGMFAVAAGGQISLMTAGTTAQGNDEMDILDKDDMFDDDGTMKSLDNQFEMQTDTPAALTGPNADMFDGSVHTRTMGDVTDKLVLYSSADPNGPAPYQSYYESADENDRDGIDSIADMTDGNVITFGMDVSDIAMRFSGSMFPSGNNIYTDVVGVDDAMTEDVMENTFSGRFHGVPGTYTCATAGGCRLTNDDMGNLADVTGTVTFTPTKLGDGDDPYSVAGVTPDMDFLAFGFWLQGEEQDDGSVKYGVNPFASGMPFATVSGLTGKATYAGPATGLFVRKTFMSDGTAVPTSAGQFTAATELTAYFGQRPVSDTDNTGTIAPNLLNKISGTVGSFMDDSGSMIDAAWMVELKPLTIAGSDITAAADGNTTTGGGEWTASFYGNPVDNMGVAVGTDDTMTPVDDRAPTSVAGEFNGHFPNGHVIGAFGATR